MKRFIEKFWVFVADMTCRHQLGWPFAEKGGETYQRCVKCGTPKKSVINFGVQGAQ